MIIGLTKLGKGPKCASRRILDVAINKNEVVAINKNESVTEVWGQMVGNGFWNLRFVRPYND